MTDKILLPHARLDADAQHLQVGFLSAASACEAPSRLRVCASFLRVATTTRPAPNPMSRPMSRPTRKEASQPR